MLKFYFMVQKLNVFKHCVNNRFVSRMPPKRKLIVNESETKNAKRMSANDTKCEVVNRKCNESSTLHLLSWNVNGLRACLKKGGLKILIDEQPDIVLFQETKCSEQNLPKEMESMTEYSAYFQSTTNGSKGYAGVGLLTKNKPVKVTFGMGIKEHDDEGRLVTAEFDHFFCICAYVPNAGRGLTRLEYRLKWNADLLIYLNRLKRKKPVIFAGDLNVAHEEIDLKNPATNRNRTAGFTDQERTDFTRLLADGFIDTFRHLYPDKKEAYTFWTYMRNARANNVGWRLDYFLVNEQLKDKICESRIHSEIMGSDHCPVSLKLAL